MSTQQDIYAAGSENHPPMLNKENYVPWSSRLLRYAKTRPNGKSIHNSILNGPYVRRMIPEPGDDNRDVNNYLQQPMPNPDDITDSTTAMNMALSLMAKAFKLNYSTPTNNNQRISSNPRNKQIAQSVQNVGNQVAQNPRVSNDGNQNEIGNGNLVSAPVYDTDGSAE
nr:ribonuclease H-like domain-containing protein [Tanacetum cinerariifolium]